jgi:hypothetical protein
VRQYLSNKLRQNAALAEVAELDNIHRSRV